MRHHFLRFLVGSVAVAGMTSFSGPLYGGDARPLEIKHASSRSRSGQAERHLKLTWTYHPKRELVENGMVRVPVPTRGVAYQSVRYEVAGALRHQVGSENGNEFMLVAPDGEKPFTVTAVVTLRRVANATPARRLHAAEAGGGTLPAFPADVRAYLEASEGIDPHSPAIQAIAERLHGRTPMATISNVLRYFRRTLHYDLRETSTDAETVLNRKGANCGGYTALFVAICRAENIPAREVWGLSRSFDRRTRHPRATGRTWYSDHAWAEVYFPGTGWVPVEPQERTFGPPELGCVRLAHHDPKRGNYLKANAAAMGAHPPAFEELKASPPETDL